MLLVCSATNGRWSCRRPHWTSTRLLPLLRVEIVLRLFCSLSTGSLFQARAVISLCMAYLLIRICVAISCLIDSSSLFVHLHWVLTQEIGKLLP